MTGHIDRDELRADVELGKRLTGTYQADSSRGYYPAMERIFTAVPALLDALDQAEARIKAVRDVLDQEAPDPHIATRVRADTIRRALDGDTTTWK